jgi:hypothetical protein
MKCPRCQELSLMLGPIGRTLKGLLNSQPVKCRCGKQTIYENLTTHAQECLIREIKCPLDCGLMLKSNMFREAQPHHATWEAHLDQCQMVLVQCSLCDCYQKRVDLRSHKIWCENYLDPCKWCKKTIVRKEMAQHLAICPEAELECLRCHQKYRRRRKRQHDCV